MLGLVLLFSPVTIAPVQQACPMITISSSAFAKGQAHYFVGVSDGDPGVSPTYNWMISNGTITTGQGTPAIMVEAEPGTNVTATVDVGGYARECPASASSTELITAADPSPCSVLGVEGSKNEKGETIFSATAVPIPTGDFTFNWSVSAGTISSGQGTGQITVEGPKGADVTATMDVGGLAPECGRSASGTFAIQ